MPSGRMGKRHPTKKIYLTCQIILIVILLGYVCVFSSYIIIDCLCKVQFGNMDGNVQAK